MVTRYTLNWSELDVVRTADSLGWGGGKGKDEYVFGAKKLCKLIGKQCSNEAGFRRFCLKQDHTGSEAEASTRIQELLKIRRCRIEQELHNLIGSFCLKRSSCSIRIFCSIEAPVKKHM